MPLTDKGAEIKGAMAKEYGDKKGEQVFYASKNAGKITGVDEDKDKDKDKSEDLSKLKKGYGSAFMTVPDEAGEGEGSEVESWAGLMSDETMSDEDMGVAMDRFDTLRDKMHALDRRFDDCAKE